jgi:transcriptional regulator with XRE-family HTH domain
MNLGENLRRLRKLKNYTLVQASQQTGVSVSFLSDMERDRTKPSLDTLGKLAECYQVSVNDLLGAADTGGATNRPLYPAGLQEFLYETSVDSDIVDLLMTMESRAKRRASSKEDWKQYYYSLKMILGR